MKRVILIRHAKSSWANPGGGDHARPLNTRGRENAEAMGAWMRGQGYVPDHILCSDAARTRETAKLLELGPPIQFEPSLYHAAPDTMLDLVRSSPAPSIAVIGHNPGMALLAAALVELRPDHPRFSDYPTCAVTVLDFEGTVDLHLGKLVEFKIPREL